MKIPLSVNINFSYSPDYPFITEEIDKYMNKLTKKMTKKFENKIRRAVKHAKSNSSKKVHL